MNKPTVFLWSLGEPSFQSKLTDALSSSTMESEQRVYQIMPLSSLQMPTGAVLIYGATQTITPKLKSVLLMASRFISEVVVLLVGCDEIKTEKAIDSIESNLRRNLSETGFEGNSAAVIRVAKKTLSKTNLKELIAKLDEKQLSIKPTETPTKIPRDHSNALLAQALLDARQMLLPSGRIQFVSSTTQELFDGPITTQFGGMPYIETKDSWPSCKQCRVPLDFLFQIDAKNHLKPTLEGAGLYVMYACLQYQHAPFFIVVTKHYPNPQPEKRKPLKEQPPSPQGLDPFLDKSVLIAYENELPSPFHLESGVLYPTFWKSLSRLTPKRKSEVWYQEIAALLFANVASLENPNEPSPEISGRVSIGGHGGASEVTGDWARPACKTCKKREMRVLANVGYNENVAFFNEFYAADIQFLVCPCDVDTVVHVAATVEDDYTLSDRYNVSME